MSPSRHEIRARPGIRNVEEPEAIPYFRNVVRIWHFPNGEALLERERKRDCLVADVDVVDVPRNGDRRIEGAVAIDTETAVEATQRGDTRILRELELSGRLE